MGIGAPRPQRPPRRGSWPGRLALALLLAGLGATWWLFLWPPAGEPLSAGPVAVLGGGGPQRLQAALGLVGEPDGDRPLLLSEGAYSEWEVIGRSCREEAVHCFDPEPGNTYGEALTVGGLLEEHGWTQVTVVTSDYHVTRSRLYFHACLDAEVRIVAVDSALPLGARVAGLPYEILGTLAALGNVFYC